MIPTFSVRRTLAAALAVATAGALLLPASPAAATPVDGYVDAFGYYRDNAAGNCDFAESNNGTAHKMFNATTGRRTARTDTHFEATPTGGSNVSADGRVDNETSGVGGASNGAFDVVRFSAEHLVRITNHTAADCGLGLIADSQSGATLHVERRGRVHIEWNKGPAGTIGQIVVSRGGPDPVFDRAPTARHGVASFRVRPGDYFIFVQFFTRAIEDDIPVGSTLTKRTNFRVVADYRR
jgi:hypothetical protein